ncbi:nitroimidazol reductase NimA-like FMN-containing flavoprotein (pyridoxamine 5'-phosphate oxidase superfamily) [Mumia flava]|uniref:Nitroimidazol reductase NimA-like FMN-containing flavoprotein (Pyridoxamine 5'-phosphate oxidase superfamily) n=1 Tax=Mumia flava TaxID=1348852 RepID=A0A2M9BH83_9ACTN|nr:pyridoxamine 5'-phosphate oxidase family protein [Mumia flava]PJJ57308.1 nitroimidazol reductase NimA-like FMN-containing flavoprotein (pyridoxamine 5'-phosphate oxidase superfamily) [Mumia flava]
MSELGDHLEPQARLVELTAHECRQLLAGQRAGRIAFVADGRIQVIPVNHMVREEALYFRTVPFGVLGEALDAGGGSMDASFQIDGIDTDSHTGWSVLASGTARREEDPDVLRSLFAPDRATPWAGGERRLWVAMDLVELTGRRIVRS